jgi:hypothetical protein
MPSVLPKKENKSGDFLVLSWSLLIKNKSAVFSKEKLNILKQHRTEKTVCASLMMKPIRKDKKGMKKLRFCS